MTDALSPVNNFTCTVPLGDALCNANSTRYQVDVDNVVVLVHVAAPDVSRIRSFPVLVIWIRNRTVELNNVDRTLMFAPGTDDMFR